MPTRRITMAPGGAGAAGTATGRDFSKQPPLSDCTGPISYKHFHSLLTADLPTKVRDSCHSADSIMRTIGRNPNVRKKDLTKDLATLIADSIERIVVKTNGVPERPGVSGTEATLFEFTQILETSTHFQSSVKIANLISKIVDGRSQVSALDTLLALSQGNPRDPHAFEKLELFEKVVANVSSDLSRNDAKCQELVFSSVRSIVSNKLVDEPGFMGRLVTITENLRGEQLVKTLSEIGSELKAYQRASSSIHWLAFNFLADAARKTERPHSNA
ncbi:MAG: hypothetical protein NT157_01905 [Candidatus Micrarchaeota archaeon]|nr:hypothetical protein [Candidatus Micrarchaeota archaeon]